MVRSAVPKFQSRRRITTCPTRSARTEDSGPRFAPSLGTPLPLRMLALTIHRDQYGLRPDPFAWRPSRSRLKPNEAKRVLVAILATGPNFNTNFAALGLPVPVSGKATRRPFTCRGATPSGSWWTPARASRRQGRQAVILDSWTGRNIRGTRRTTVSTPSSPSWTRSARAGDRGPAEPHPERLAAMLLTYGTAYRAVAERLSVRPGIRSSCWEAEKGRVSREPRSRNPSARGSSSSDPTRNWRAN